MSIATRFGSVRRSGNESASRAFNLSTEAVIGKATHQIIGGPGGIDEAVYRELGRVCDSLPTWSVYVISSNQWFEKHFGRRAPRRRKLYNGRLECQFYQYLGPAPPRERTGTETGETSPDVSPETDDDSPMST